MKSIIESYSNGQLRPYKITITPKLDIEIGRLDYAIGDPGDGIYHEGFSRSINVSWSILSERPFLEAQVGPTLITDIFLADQLNLYTPPFSDIDFRKILITAEMSNLDMLSIFKSESLLIKAFYEGDKNLLNAVSIDMAAVSTEAPHSWTLADLNARISQLDLSAPVDEQPIMIKVSAAEVENIRNKLNFLGLSGVFIFSESEIEFQINSKDFTYQIYDNFQGAINAKGLYVQNGLLKKAQIEFSNPSAEDRATNRPSISVDILGIEDGRYEIRSVGNMGSFELNVGDSFVGTLPPSTFKIDLFVDGGGSGVNGISEFRLNKNGAPEIIGKADFNFELYEFSNVIDCIVLDCEISSLNAVQQVNFEQEWFSIISKCHSPPCNMAFISHILKTSNTAEIFSYINQAKILNPLYSIYLYKVINEGKKVENGHEVYIN